MTNKLSFTEMKSDEYIFCCISQGFLACNVSAAYLEMILRCFFFDFPNVIVKIMVFHDFFRAMRAENISLTASSGFIKVRNVMFHSAITHSLQFLSTVTLR